MRTKEISRKWFACWEQGKIHQLPLNEQFTHQSPFGIVNEKSKYIKWVEEYKAKFLGYTFEIQDEIYSSHRACIRYTARQGNFELEVSEWHYFKNTKIDKIISYYHIGEIRNDRAMNLPE